MRTPTAVARWVFEGPGLGREPELRDLADLTAAALRIMAVSRLLAPRRLYVSEWLDPDGVAVPGSSARRADGAILDAKTLAATLIGLAPPHHTPSRVGVSGWSLLVGADGSEQWTSQAVAVEAHVWVDVLVTVETFVDAWLEHDLLGSPQPQVYQRNGPRLEKALTEIAALPGVELTEGESTRHALVVGPRAINVTDLNGFVVATLDDPADAQSI